MYRWTRPVCRLPAGVSYTLEIGGIKFANPARLLVGGIVLGFGDQFPPFLFLGRLDQFVAEAGFFQHEADDLDAVFFFQGWSTFVYRL